MPHLGPDALCQPAITAPFDVRRYQQLVALGEDAARWGTGNDTSSWLSLSQLQRDTASVDLLRTSFETEHAETTVATVEGLLNNTGSRSLRAYGMRVALGDDGQTLLRAIERQPDTPAADRLIDLLALAYTKHTTVLPELTPHLMRLLPPRVLRDCQQHDAQEQLLPSEKAASYAKLLGGLGFGIAKHKDRIGYAKQLLETSRQQPRGSNADRVIRQLFIDQNFLDRYMFAAVGLDHKFIERLWFAGYGQDTLPDNTPDPRRKTHAQYVEECAQRILDIERQRPGGVRLLARRFLLRNIGRVPEDWQLDLIDTSHKRYARAILVGIAPWCPNGAMEEVTERINQERKALPEDTIMLPAEIASAEELEERLGFLERAISLSSHTVKIVGAVMTGHGHEGRKGNDMRLTIIYGPRAPVGEELQADNIEGAIGDLLGRLLVPDAQALLISCSIAKGKNNFAGRLHKRIGRHVTGMREAAGLRRLRIVQRRDSDAVRFEPSFVARIANADDNTWRYRTSRARHFRPAPPESSGRSKQ
jgi:hypothetical protein